MPDRTSHGLSSRRLGSAVLGVLLLLTAPALARKQKPLPCEGGRYRVDTEPLVVSPGTVIVDALLVARDPKPSLALGDACAAGQVRLKRSRKGTTTVKAKWTTCGSVKRKMSLKGTFSEDCATLRGTLVAAKAKKLKLKKSKQAFTARRSSCGDGVLDPGNGEQCEAASDCFEGGRCDGCECTPGNAVGNVRFGVRPPSSVVPGQQFPLSVEVDCNTPVRGRILACPRDVPPTLCDSADPFQIAEGAGAFSGSGGTFSFTVTRGTDCAGPGEYYLMAELFFADRGGKYFGPYLSADLPTTQLAAPAQRRLALDSDGPLSFTTLAGVPSDSRSIAVLPACGSGPFNWTATADSAWLRITPTTGRIEGADDVAIVTLTADPAGLAPGTYPTTLVLSAPETSETTSLAVTLTVRGDTIRWTQPPPGQIGTDQAFTVSLEVQSPAPYVEGQVLACPTDVPVGECEATYPLDFGENEGFFDGPPGTFTVPVRRAGDCLEAQDYYFVAKVAFTDDELNLSDRVAGPPAATTLLTSTERRLELRGVDDDGEGGFYPLVFNALVGQTPRPQTVQLAACTGPTAWTATSSAAWLQPSPVGGTIGARSVQDVSLSVDPAILVPAAAPYRATVTFSAAGLPPISFPVQLNFRNDVTMTWVTPPPAEIASGATFPLALAVAGTFGEMDGDIAVCEPDTHPEGCFGSYPFALSPEFFNGGPQTYTFTARASEATAHTFVPKVFLLGQDFDVFGPFTGPPAPTRLLPGAPSLRAFPNELALTAILVDGSEPPATRISVQEGCGRPLGWQATSSAPWLGVAPTSGTTNGAIDVTGVPGGLDPAQSPYRGSLTVSAPEASNGPVSVPVTLNLVCG